MKPRPYVVLGLETTPGSMPMGKGEGPQYWVGPGGSFALDVEHASVFGSWQDADDVAQEMNRELGDQGFHFWAWPDYADRRSRSSLSSPEVNDDVKAA